jgi:hypothetical protein
VKSEEVRRETFGFLHFKSKWTNPKDLHLTSSLFTLTSNFQIWVYRPDKPKFEILPNKKSPAQPGQGISLCSFHQ